MFSTSRSILSLLPFLCTVTQAKPHANPHRHQHHGRAAAARVSNVGIVYDGDSNLEAFSGRLGFSVDWSPLPLDSSDGLDLGTFIPQLWTFQDSNRESPYCHTYLVTAGVVTKCFPDRSQSLEQCCTLMAYWRPINRIQRARHVSKQPRKAVKLLI